MDRQVLKGTRWLLLKNPENLKEHRNERQQLEEALSLNSSLATGYYLKEDLRRLWQQPNYRAATKLLTAWCRRAMASGMRVLQKMASTLQRHRRGILNWYTWPISTGPLEGTNNKIKTLSRQAYGFRDMSYFKLKIKAIHLANIKLVG